MPKPTYAELLTLVVELKKHIAAQDTRIAELERRIASTSRNSSKPPSSDGLGKPDPKSLRKKSGRRPGGQNGHPGRTLQQVPDPDEVTYHEPVSCRGCGAGLTQTPRVGLTRRQVFDLPPIRISVTEHQLASHTCPCGTTTTADAPEGVNAPVQYGPRVLAFIVYLYMGQYLSKDRTAKAMSELFNTPVATGTVSAATARASTDLQGFTDTITKKIADADVAHFDETGFRVTGKLHWLHCASTPLYTLITCHRRRGRQAMDAAGVLPHFTGTAVHDAWAPYDTYPNLTHALCNAHLLRELIAVTDHHATTPNPTHWCWAAQAIDNILAIKNLTDTGDHDPDHHAPHHRLLLHAARIGATTPLPGPLGAKHRALARRITTRTQDYLRYTTNPNTPFDNNAAEREIRMAKLRQKVSGGMRTLTGAQHFATLRSYLSTTNKHNITAIDALTQLTNRKPWQPQTT